MIHHLAVRLYDKTWVSRAPHTTLEALELAAYGWMEMFVSELFIISFVKSTIM